MSRTGRNRSRSTAFGAGTATSSKVGLVDSNSGFKVIETCQDSIGRPLTSSSFSVDKTVRNCPPLSGEIDHAIYGHMVLSNYVPQYPRGTGISGSSLVSLTGGSADVVARTNPSRPVVNPLTLAQDLIDIPKQLREVGRLIRTPRRLLNPREQANQFLGLKFGWLPLIDDLQKLSDMQKYIHQRAGELQRLYSKGGLKRTVRLSRAVGSTSKQVVLASSVAGCQVSGTETTICVGERWGSVRWKPTTTPPYNPSDSSQILKVRQLAYGMTVEGLAQGAWDLIPWTWVTDWFFDVGTFMLQNSMTIPAVPTDVCVMTQYTTNVEWSGFQTSYGPWKGAATRTQKMRAVGNAGVTARLPHLDASRLSILSALFVQRFKRSTFNF